MRTAILLSTPVLPDLKEKIGAGLHPQQDYFALAEALRADLIAPLKPGNGSGQGLARGVEVFRTAWAAFRQRHRYDLIISDVERAGLVLAALLKLSASKNHHVMVCHGKVANGNYIRLIRALGLHTHIHRFVCYGPAVADTLQSALGLPEHCVLTVRHPADHNFWHPLPVTPELIIASAGLLRRDYATLIKAVAGLDVAVIIAASSPWVSSSSNGSTAHDLPSNVHVTRCNYLELRNLYARSLFVAVPLLNSRAQSGSLVMYEAMAMGKALVATRTEGQGALEIIREGETGYYVAPGDVQGWRNAIRHLCANPQEALEMGQRAREIVDDGLNMETYVQDIARAVQPLAAKPHQRSK